MTKIFLFFTFIVLGIKTNYIKVEKLTSYESFRDICLERNITIKANNATILCLYDKIDSESIKFIKNKKSKIDYIIIKSKGGDVNSAIQLGYFIFKNKIK